jgi:hypothetical protein
MTRFGQPIKVNWAYTSTQREDTSGISSLQVCASSCRSLRLLKLSSNLFLQVILTSLLGIFARRSLMLLCFLFSRHILPARKRLIALHLTVFAYYILLYHFILVTCAEMLGLCGIRKLDDPEGSVLFLLGISR